MRRFLLSWKILLLAALLSACSGLAGGGASAPPGETGPGAGGDLDNPGAVTDNSVGGKPTFSTANATGDGTLGSQSPSSDLVPGFIREFSLNFPEYDQDFTTPGFSYVLPSSPGSLPNATVKKIQDGYKESPCPTCSGSWVRAVDCGAYTDADIEKLIPEEEKGHALAANPLLWFLIHMPRAAGNSAIVTCEGGQYQDFSIAAGGVVDLSGLEVSANDILVFYLVDANPGPELGPLSTNGFMQIPKEVLAATGSKHGILRYSRPAAPVKFSPQVIQILQTH